MTFVSAQVLEYPKTRRQIVTDDYHGTKVEDPYRWLEDDNSPETKAWVKAQNAVTESFLGKIPQRQEIRERLSKLYDYERVGLPKKEGGRWFYSKNSGLQNQSVLYVVENLEAEPRVLLDPNALADDGTVSVANRAISEDGKWLAYSISRAGSDWQEVHVRNVDTGKDSADLLKWVKFSGLSWAKDGSGFYYSRYAEPAAGAEFTGKNEFQKLYFHRLGQTQEQDELIYERKDQPKWGISAGVTDDGDYLILHLTEGTNPNNRLFYKSLKDANSSVVELLSAFDASYDFLGNDGPVFYFLTDQDAPRKRVISIDVRSPEKWHEVIPQTAEQLDEAGMVGGQLVCTYLKDAWSLLVCYDLNGKLLRKPELPGIGTIGGFDGKKEDREVYYAYTSYTQPTAIYRYDLASGKSTLWRHPRVDFDGSRFETTQVFYNSKDGTRVPMFLVYRKDLVKDGSHRTLLYGYGGFQINMSPYFSPDLAVWLERGGILAIPNLRGGGEYGREWHEAGRLAKKQNVFDDFIAAAEYLIREKYTSSPKLAIQGGSNGGLLVGACMTQRPELFGAALPAVGVMDMLRFQKFTIGWAWVSEYGSSDQAEQFKTLFAYSPYHRLMPGKRYPATMITTADHDDRVVPAHSFKFAARLQACQAAHGPPVLIRIETSAGHGNGTALSKKIGETTDEWAFLEAVLK
ncbi:MAG: prolyl oligopeptidase family serine peptidase [Luteolibacter sp.]